MSPSDGGQCLKVSLIASLAICIALTREIFFLNLNFFFFPQRSPQTNYSSGAALQKRTLRLRWQGWSVRRRLSWHGEGGDLIHVNSGRFLCVHQDSLVRELGACGCRALHLLWETAVAGLEPQHVKGIDPLHCYLQHRHNLLLGLTCKCSFAELEGDGAIPLPAWDAAVKRVGKAKP